MNQPPSGPAAIRAQGRWSRWVLPGLTCIGLLLAVIGVGLIWDWQLHPRLICSTEFQFDGMRESPTSSAIAPTTSIATSQSGSVSASSNESDTEPPPSFGISKSCEPLNALTAPPAFLALAGLVLCVPAFIKVLPAGSEASLAGVGVKAPPSSVQEAADATLANATSDLQLAILIRDLEKRVAEQDVRLSSIEESRDQSQSRPWRRSRS